MCCLLGTFGNADSGTAIGRFGSCHHRVAYGDIQITRFGMTSVRYPSGWVAEQIESSLNVAAWRGGSRAWRPVRRGRLQAVLGRFKESEVLCHVRERLPGAGPPDLLGEEWRRDDGDRHFAELASVGLPE